MTDVGVRFSMAAMVVVVIVMVACGDGDNEPPVLPTFSPPQITASPGPLGSPTADDPEVSIADNPGSAADPSASVDTVEVPIGGSTATPASPSPTLNPGTQARRFEPTVTVLDQEGTVGPYTSLAIGADRLGLVSYHDFTEGDLKVAHCENPECTEATTSRLDTEGFTGLWTSIAIGSDGLGIISYFDLTNGDLRAAHCEDLQCSEATTSIVDSEGRVGDYTSVAIGGDGLPLISYHDSTNHALKVAHCEEVDCSKATLTTLDDRGTGGIWTSIAVGPDGMGFVSYHNRYNRSLNIARCLTVDCKIAALHTVDEGEIPRVGDYTAVAFSAEGLPLVTYHQLFFTHDLMLASCQDPTCVDAELIKIDDADGAGMYSDIVLGADGQALISYYDFDGGSLKIAHCPDRFCGTRP